MFAKGMVILLAGLDSQCRRLRKTRDKCYTCLSGDRRHFRKKGNLACGEQIDRLTGDQKDSARMWPYIVLGTGNVWQLRRRRF